MRLALQKRGAFRLKQRVRLLPCSLKGAVQRDLHQAYSVNACVVCVATCQWCSTLPRCLEFRHHQSLSTRISPAALAPSYSAHVKLVAVRSFRSRCERTTLTMRMQGVGNLLEFVHCEYAHVVPQLGPIVVDAPGNAFGCPSA